MSQNRRDSAKAKTRKAKTQGRDRAEADGRNARVKPKRVYKPKDRFTPKRVNKRTMKEVKKNVKGLAFGKRSHVSVVKMIAEGLRAVGQLSVYLELGTAKGACFNQVAPLADVAIAVDHDPDKYEYVYQNKNLVWHASTTKEFLKRYRGDPFDLVFVDAGHEFESSWYDFQHVAPLVRSNGIILLHDTYPPNENFLHPDLSGDTWKTAWKIRQELSNKYEIVTLPFYFGISIVRKCRKQLEWHENEEAK